MRRFVCALGLVACGERVQVRDAPPKAGQILVASCDSVRMVTITDDHAPPVYVELEVETWADLALPGFDPRAAPAVSVILCNPVLTGGAVRPAEPKCGREGLEAQAQFNSGYEQPHSLCQFKGYEPPTLECRPAAAVTFAPGRILVSCGRGGEAFQTAYIRIVE